MTTKDNEGNKGEIKDTAKVTIYCQIYRRVCNVRGGYMWSSARWMMSIAGMGGVDLVASPYCESYMGQMLQC